MTATTQTAAAPLVSQPDESMLWVARRENLRLVKVQRYPRWGAAGQKVGEFPGETVPFKEGTLRVPMAGTLRLEDGREVDAAEINEWLESHPLKGDIEEGFWRVDPTAPPVSGEEMKAIARAATSFDEETLTRMIEQEKAGWGRADLIEAAGEAIAGIRSVKAEAAAQARAEAEAAKKPRGKASQE